MYIDVESESQINEYLKGRERRYEYQVDIVVGEYMSNYLVLEEIRDDNIPSKSEIDILREFYPDGLLPTCYLLTVESLDDGKIPVGPAKASPDNGESPPPKFIISIRSEYSTHQKLTIDQNEAMLCSFSHYHPRPPPRVMYVRNDAGINAREYDREFCSNIIDGCVLYKGALVLPVPVPYYPNGLDISRSNVSSKRSISALIMVHYNDNFIKLQYPRRNLYSDIYQLPPPFHSNFLVSKLFPHAETRPLNATVSRLVVSTIKEFPNFAHNLHSDAYIPHFDTLMQLASSS